MVSVLSSRWPATSHSRCKALWGWSYNTFEETDVFLKAVRRIAEGGTNVG